MQLTFWNEQDQEEPTRDEYVTDPTSYNPNEEIFQRMKSRSEREGYPEPTEPGYEPMPDTPRDMRPKSKLFLAQEQNWPGIPEIQHPIATALNLASRGAGMVTEAFRPSQPGTDPMSLRPQELMRQLRQGIVSDEDLAEIQRDPTSPRSLGAYALAGIALSRGAGGEGEGGLKWHIVPAKEWESWKPTDLVLPGSHGGEIKVDPEGNHYQVQGSHYNKERDEWHAIVQPLSPPAEPPPELTQDIIDKVEGKKPFDEPPPEPGTKEYWKKIEDQYTGTMLPEDVAKLPEVQPPPVSKPGEPSGLDKMLADWHAKWKKVGDLAKELQDKVKPKEKPPVKKQFEDLTEQLKDIKSKGKSIPGSPDANGYWGKKFPGQSWNEIFGLLGKPSDEGLPTPKEAQDMQAYMDSLKNKPKMQPEEHFPNWDESHGVKEAKFDDAGHVDTLREYATRNNLSAEEYHKLLDASLSPKPPLPPGAKDLPPGDWWLKGDKKHLDKISDDFKGFLDKLPIKEDSGPPDAPLPDWAKDHLPPKEPYYPKEQDAFEKWKKGEISWDEYKNWHKEGVGPVDWDWYKPRSKDWWNEVRWKYPPDDWEMYGRPPDNEPPM